MLRNIYFLTIKLFFNTLYYEMRDIYEYLYNLNIHIYKYL